MNRFWTITVAVLGIVVLSVAIWFVVSRGPMPTDEVVDDKAGNEQMLPEQADNKTPQPDVEAVAEGLEVPWDIAFLPGGDMLVTERPGRIWRINSNGERARIAYQSGVEHVGEGGLLGLTLHPNFAENKLVYIYRTVNAEAGNNFLNRIDQYELQGNELVKTENTAAILPGDQIPGAPYHDGGRMEFGPDGKLYIAVGDATREGWAQIAQSEDSLERFAGTILRINADGSIPEDNPFGNAVWSYGHRNPQGLAWDAEGRLWSTEHGRSGALSGLDEINLIEPGANYGWPTIEGDEGRDNMRKPVAHSGPNTTWAPASALHYEGSLFFGGLRGEALYEAKLNGSDVVRVIEHFKGEFGRIRTVRLGPDGYFYITTSNRDGRGTVQSGDDKIIRINPTAL